MPLIPKCMSTQHPDNAASPPYATDGVLKGEGEITEAATVFSLGCDEQLWDSEGKDVDLRVVQKLLSSYPDFFRHERQLGRDCALTLRLPNPAIESEMRKSLAEALHGIPAAWDVASKFYGGEMEPPIQDVILPLTTSAQELKLIDAYYRMLVVGQESKTLAGGETVKDLAWCYRYPAPEAAKVAGLLCFPQGKVDMYVDGELQEKPKSRWD